MIFQKRKVRWQFLSGEDEIEILKSKHFVGWVPTIDCKRKTNKQTKEKLRVKKEKFIEILNARKKWNPMLTKV